MKRFPLLICPVILLLLVTAGIPFAAATPILSGVTPDHGTYGQTVTVTVSGTGFDPSNTVYLYRCPSKYGNPPDTGLIYGTKIIRSATSITATFQLSGSQVVGGVYDVVVSSSQPPLVWITEGFTVNGGPVFTIPTPNPTWTPPVPARSKIGVWRNGLFLVRESPTVTTPVSYGLPTDTPLAGDWTGTGSDTVGVWRNGVFFLRESPTVTTPVAYGLPTDTPLAGDWTGSGNDSVGVFRGLENGAGVFYLRESPAVTKTIYYGLSTDTPFVWNDNGISKAGVFRGLENGAGVFYLRNSETVTTTVYYGLSTDTPVLGDWTGTGTDSIGVFRGLENGAGVFYLRESPTVTTPVYYGLSSDTPIAGTWG